MQIKNKKLKTYDLKFKNLKEMEKLVHQKKSQNRVLHILKQSWEIKEMYKAIARTLS